MDDVLFESGNGGKSVTQIRTELDSITGLSAACGISHCDAEFRKNATGFRGTGEKNSSTP